MRGVTIRIVPTLVYSARALVVEPPALRESVELKIGIAVVTSRRVSWLSRVTARGVASTRESDSEFRNESAALTPCALRKATFGANPPAEDKLTIPLSRVVFRVSVFVVVVLLPVSGSAGLRVVRTSVEPPLNKPLPIWKR